MRACLHATGNSTCIITDLVKPCTKHALAQTHSHSHSLTLMYTLLPFTWIDVHQHDLGQIARIEFRIEHVAGAPEVVHDRCLCGVCWVFGFWLPLDCNVHFQLSGINLWSSMYVVAAAQATPQILVGSNPRCA